VAKLLVFDRTAQQVSTLDSITGALAALGNVIATADITNGFPNRSQNLIATFKGDSYFLYRTIANQIKLAKYSGGVWTDSLAFGTVSPGTGDFVPTGLVVIGTKLIAIFSLSNSAGIDGIFIKDTTDDVVWSVGVSIINPFLYQPATTHGGHVMVWRNAVWITSTAGLVYYDPASSTFGVAFDNGSDGLIADEKVTHGCFASWSNDLYYLLPTTSAVQLPKLYKLNDQWTVAVPSAIPAWTNTGVAFPTAGALSLGNDGPTYALFVNRNTTLTAWYSGNVRTRVVLLQETGGGLTPTDVTDLTLTATISAKTYAGWSIYVDDRRRSNEQQMIVCRDIGNVPNQIILFSWSGVGFATLMTTLDNGGLGFDLMLPNEERGDFRTFTDVKPAAFITATSTPWAGRTQIDYTIRDALSRPVAVFGEYSLDKQTWAQMTQGDADSGSTNLVTSPLGVSYFFYWDAFEDLADDYNSVDIRIVVRISGP